MGYGTYAKYTPALLALGIVLVIAYIGWQQWRPDADLPRAGVLIDQPAPDWSLALLDGSTVTSADLADRAVVLNFWASWCAPCEAEMPELERLNADLVSEGVPATIIGVGVKRDNNDNALAMVDRLGITYPIGRDTAGENDNVLGPVTQAFGVLDTFPCYRLSFARTAPSPRSSSDLSPRTPHVRISTTPSRKSRGALR